MATEVSVTVAKAFRVLRLFHHHAVVTGALCERELGIPRSTAHRLLLSLREAGVVEQTAGGHYVLSVSLFELGVLAPQRKSLEERIGSNVEELAYTTGQRVNVAIRHGLQLVYIDAANGPIAQAKGIRTRVGYSGPLHATASGKLLLAHSDPELLQQVLAAGTEAFTPQTVIDEVGLRRELEQIRREGFAIARGQFAINAAALAVPIRGWDGLVQASLSIVGDNVSIAKHRTRYLEEARRTAARIERGVGGTYRRAIRNHSLVVST